MRTHHHPAPHTTTSTSCAQRSVTQAVAPCRRPLSRRRRHRQPRRRCRRRRHHRRRRPRARGAAARATRAPNVSRAIPRAPPAAASSERARRSAGRHGRRARLRAASACARSTHRRAAPPSPTPPRSTSLHQPRAPPPPAPQRHRRHARHAATSTQPPHRAALTRHVPAPRELRQAPRRLCQQRHERAAPHPRTCRTARAPSCSCVLNAGLRRRLVQHHAQTPDVSAVPSVSPARLLAPCSTTSRGRPRTWPAGHAHVDQHRPSRPPPPRCYGFRSRCSQPCAVQVADRRRQVQPQRRHLRTPAGAAADYLDVGGRGSGRSSVSMITTGDSAARAPPIRARCAGGSDARIRRPSRISRLRAPRSSPRSGRSIFTMQRVPRASLHAS